MSQAEVEYGLRRLAVLAPDFRIGKLDIDDRCSLRFGGRRAVVVSREILEDLQGTPDLEVTLREGLDLAREEARKPTPELILITTTGVRYID